MVTQTLPLPGMVVSLLVKKWMLFTVLCFFAVMMVVTASTASPAPRMANSPENNAAASNLRWEVLVLIYRTIDFTYTDSMGTQRHVIATMTQLEMDTAANASRLFFESDVPVLTSEDQSPVLTVRYPSHALTQLESACGDYWSSRANTAADLDPAFDSVVVIWDNSGTDVNTGQTVDLQRCGGLTVPNGIGQTYSTFPIFSATTNHRNVFKHEWGHSILYYFDAAGTAPLPTVDNHIHDTERP